MKRICSVCKIEKDINDFSKDKYAPTGYTGNCKKCRANVRYMWAKNNPEKVRLANIKNKEKRDIYYSKEERKLKYRKSFISSKFKIPYSEYERMQEFQQNKCAICKKEETHIEKTYLSVDHCHSTGSIRGLLCSRCNFGLGYFKDNIENLQNAIKYLNNHENKSSIAC